MCSVCKGFRRDVLVSRCVVCSGEESTVTIILSSCIDSGTEILPKLSHISIPDQLTVLRVDGSLVKVGKDRP